MALKLKGLLRNRAYSSCSCPPEYFLMKVEVSNEKSKSLGLCAYLKLFNLTIGKQARMKSKPGSGKRQERNFEIVVNHITTNEDQLPQVSRQSMAALKDVFGHNIKKYSGTLHHKPGNEHVHFLVMSAAPKTKSAVLLPPWHSSLAQRLGLWT